MNEQGLLEELVRSVQLLRDTVEIQQDLYLSVKDRLDALEALTEGKTDE